MAGPGRASGRGAHVGDPLFLAKLTELLETRDPVNLPLEVLQNLGITIAIPAELLLRSARRRAPDIGTVTSRSENPAAGALPTPWQIPANEIWLPRAITAVLVTDATAVNRDVQLVADDGTGIFGSAPFFRLPTPLIQGAGTTVRYNWTLGGADKYVAASNLAWTVLPLTFLVAPMRLGITVAAAGMQAGDDWGAVTLLFDRYS